MFLVYEQEEDSSVLVKNLDAEILKRAGQGFLILWKIVSETEVQELQMNGEFKNVETDS